MELSYKPKLLIVGIILTGLLFKQKLTCMTTYIWLDYESSIFV